MMTRDRLREWPLAAAALIILALAATADFQPDLFAEPAGRVRYFGGPWLALLVPVGFALRSRLIYVLTVVGLVGWCLVTAARIRQGVGSSATEATAVAASLLALALLTLPHSSRRWFGYHTRSSERQSGPPLDARGSDRDDGTPARP